MRGVFTTENTKLWVNSLKRKTAFILLGILALCGCTPLGEVTVECAADGKNGGISVAFHADNEMAPLLHNYDSEECRSKL